jgi:hypothetical protein
MRIGRHLPPVSCRGIIHKREAPLMRHPGIESVGAPSSAVCSHRRQRHNMVATNERLDSIVHRR